MTPSLSNRHQRAVEDSHKRDTWQPVLHVDSNESPKTVLESRGTDVKTRCKRIQTYMHVQYHYEQYLQLQFNREDLVKTNQLV